MTFEAFRQSLQERRRYLDQIGECKDLKKRHPERFKSWTITQINPLDYMVEGSHVMNPGNPSGLAEVNERFHIQLPNDMDQFYREWNGGYLLLSVPYELLSAKEIIEKNEEMRLGRKEPLLKPWNIVRFAHIADGNYIGLSFVNSNWHILFISIEYGDEELSGKIPRQGIPVSFSEWLEFILKTDGELPGIWEKTFQRIP